MAKPNLKTIYNAKGEKQEIPSGDWNKSTQSGVYKGWGLNKPSTKDVAITKNPKYKDPLYIGATDWGNIQKQIGTKEYTPEQVNWATETKNGDKFWRSDREISKWKPKSELDNIADDINAGQDFDFAKKEKDNGDDIKTRKGDFEEKVDETRDMFTGGSARPEMPSMTDLYKEFQEGGKGEMYKTTELEESLSAFKDDARNSEARMRERVEFEESKPVAMGVIQGKTGEIEKQEQKNIDFANRQIAYITDQLNTKYNMIETIMNLTQVDYTNAVNSYDKEFSQNMDIINFVKGEEKDLQSEQDKKQDNARANMQIVINSLTKGNMNFSDLSDDQKLEMRKLEIQAGLPSGFMESLKSNIDETSKLVSTTARTDPSGNKYLDVLTRDDSGVLKLSSVYAGKVRVAGSGGSSGWPTGTPTSYKEWELAGKPGKYEDYLKGDSDDDMTESEKITKDVKDMSTKLDAVSGDDGFISPKDYATAKKAWTTKAGHKAKDFDEHFSVFRNPDNDEYAIEY